MSQRSCFASQGVLELAFLAEPQELAELRRRVRLHLACRELTEVADAAELCVSELVANVITHVGEQTPTALRLSITDTHVRIEVGDPDTRALPTLLAPTLEAESGRGMALLDAVAERWGVVLRENSKVTWCELAKPVRSPTVTSGSQMDRVETLMCSYGVGELARSETRPSLGIAVAEEAAIEMIADLLRWLRSHGCDPDEVLDRAQAHAVAETT